MKWWDGLHGMAIILSLKDSDSYLSIQSNRLPHGCDEQPELKVNYNLLYVLVKNNENGLESAIYSCINCPSTNSLASSSDHFSGWNFQPSFEIELRLKNSCLGNFWNWKFFGKKFSEEFLEFFENVFDREKNFQRFKNPEDATKNLEFNYFLVSGKNFQKSVVPSKKQVLYKIFKVENWLAQRRLGSGTAGRPVDREEMQRHGLKIHKKLSKTILVIKYGEISIRYEFWFRKVY